MPGYRGSRGQGRIPIGSRPHTALGQALPNAHQPPGLPPGTAESNPGSGGKGPRGARHHCPSGLHGHAVQKGAGTGSEQQLDHDGYRRGVKSTRVKESSATSTGTQDVQLVATKSSLANRGEQPRYHLHPCRAIWDPKSAVTGIAHTAEQGLVKNRRGHLPSIKSNLQWGNAFTSWFSWGLFTMFPHSS